MLVLTRMHWASPHKWLLPVILGLALAGCGNDMESAPAPGDISKESVRVEVAGMRFNVPLNYLYQEAIEEKGHWPAPKNERISVGALTISVLLPDLRPYRPADDARWRVRGYGDRIEIGIKQPTGGMGWYTTLHTRIGSEVERGISKRKSDEYALEHFLTPVSDRFFPLDGRPLSISCTGPTPRLYVRCMTKVDYKKNIVLEYYYGREHLRHWREIDDGLKRLVDKFAADAS